MKLSSKIVGVLIFVFFSIQMYAQFGVRLKYNKNTYSDIEKVLNNEFRTDEKVFKTGIEAGVDYWFRLKKQRIEFMPELAYSYASTTISATKGLDNVRMTGINFNFHTQLYALDMEGDCDCPTFSKQGASINKGLFFHFTPGLGYYTADAKINDNATISYEKADNLIFRAGVGMGLDLGINDLLTITPIISYYFHTKFTWDGLPTTQSDVMLSAADNQKLLQFTLRFGFRPDYSSRRYRR